jgi:enamine deaminase RidA (YjgF/YER057c/UK114 family)
MASSATMMKTGKTMSHNEQSFQFENASVQLFTFDNGTEVREHHAMIHVTDASLPFTKQLEAVTDAYDRLLQEIAGAQAVFKRYFLSDAANQQDEVIVGDVTDCAKSIIEQPPLDGTKVALWVYLMTGVSTSLSTTGLYVVSHGQFRHLWNGSAHNLAANSEYQTRLLFNEYNMQLLEEGCTLKDNCIRTWFFVNDIDLNYGGVVRARNQVFFTQGLTVHTHFIASTGIGGRQGDPNVLSQMDNYAVAGLQPEQVFHLYASTHLNRTSDYGVSFERGTCVDYADRRQVFISGTASINNKGEIMYAKDVVKQTERMWENVEKLLAEADCTYDDVAQMIVYLRDTSDYQVVRKLYEQRFPTKPFVIVWAPVCRSGWLVEMECMAVKAINQPSLPRF